jgi:hypothetical protein
MDTFWIDAGGVAAVLTILAIVCGLVDKLTGGWLLRGTRAQFERLSIWLLDPTGYKRKTLQLIMEKVELRSEKDELQKENALLKAENDRLSRQHHALQVKVDAMPNAEQVLEINTRTLLNERAQLVRKTEDQQQEIDHLKELLSKFASRPQQQSFFGNLRDKMF